MEGNCFCCALFQALALLSTEKSIARSPDQQVGLKPGAPAPYPVTYHCSLSLSPGLDKLSIQKLPWPHRAFDVGAASAVALGIILEPSSDLPGPPVICTCPVHSPACSQRLTYLAPQFDSLLTYLAAIMLPALFPRPCMATSLVVDYMPLHPRASGLQVAIRSGGL